MKRNGGRKNRRECNRMPRNDEPRGIYPKFPIKHLRDPTNKQAQYFQCSVCGFISAKIRNDWEHHYNCVSQLKFQINDIYKEKKSIPYTTVIKNLIDPQTQKIITFQKILQLRREYIYFRKHFLLLKKGEQRTRNIKKLEQQYQEAQSQIERYKDQMKSLREQMREFRQQKQRLRAFGIEDPQASIKKRQAINNVKEILFPILQLKIDTQISKIFSEHQDISYQSKMEFVKSATHHIFTFTYQDISTKWKKSLEAYFIQKTNPKDKRDMLKTTRQKKLLQRVYSILLEIPINIVKDTELFVQRIRIQKIYVQKAILTFVNALIDGGKLTIPKFKSSVIQRYNTIIKKSIDYSEVKFHLAVLVKNNEKILACDFWFCFVLGLRLHDLKRVFISNSNYFFDYIQIVEKKNENKTQRVIPTSLRKLCLWSHAKYPIGSQRLQNLKRFCKLKFGRFYQLRKLCITRTFAGLMSGSGFQAHRQSKTTLKYYINYNDFQLMDAIFYLPLEFQDTNQDKKILYAKSNKKASFEDCLEPQISDVVQFQGQIILPSALNLKDEIKSDAFELCIGSLKQLQVFQDHEQTATSQLSFVQSLVNDIDYSKHLVQVCKKNQCLFSVLTEVLNEDILVIYNNKVMKFYDKNILTKMEEQMFQKIDNFSNLELKMSNPQIQRNNSQKNQQIFKQNNQMLIQQIEQHEPSQHSQINKDSEDQQDVDQDESNEQKQIQEAVEPLIKIVLSKNKTNMTEKHLQLQINSEIQNNLLKFSNLVEKQQQSNVINQAKVIIGLDTIAQPVSFTIMKKGDIKAVRKSQRIVKKQKNFYQFQEYCDVCKELFDIQKCLNCRKGLITCSCIDNTMIADCKCKKSNGSFSFQQKLKPGPESLQQDFELKRPKFTQIQNNIQEFFNKTKRKRINQMLYSNQLKNIIFLNDRNVLNYSMDRIVSQVRDKEDYLPIQIKKCEDNSKKQLGVFALIDIEKDVVVSTYLGVVKPEYEIDPQENSLLSLGFSSDRRFVGVNCIEASNLGRFFNCHIQKSKVNLKLRISFSKDSQLCPFLYTSKKVKRGEELVWFYGKDYKIQ